MADAQHDLTLTLADGRQLGYAEYGDPAGLPAFYFHGFPGCRYEAGPLSAAAADNGIRLVAIDRPGMGLSDLVKGRKILDWPADVATVANQLGWHRFAVVGMSGGGPYALVCAAALNERLTHCVLMAGVAPLSDKNATKDMMRLNRLLFAVARHFPWVMGPLFSFVSRTIVQRPDNYFESTAKNLPEADRILFTDPALKKQLLPIIREPYRRGSKGAAIEGHLYVTPWGFELDKIQTEVTIWQGSEDVNVPPGMAHYQDNRLPNSQLNILEGEGHLSLLFNRGTQVFAALKKQYQFTRSLP